MRRFTRKKKMPDETQNPAMPQGEVNNVDSPVGDEINNSESEVPATPTPPEETASISTDPPEDPIAPIGGEVPAPDDRSVYNCSSCKGEGMTFPISHPEGLICPVCHGSGGK